jgi:CP family cyanate transporter-like MFS transporter
MVGFGGVALFALAAPWAWSALIGLSVGLLFPVGVMLPLDYGSDPREVRRLTAMSLSIGYLLAALGPFLLGWLRGATGSYTVPFLVLVLACAAMLTQIPALRPVGVRSR